MDTRDFPIGSVRDAVRLAEMQFMESGFGLVCEEIIGTGIFRRPAK